jgi:hypothetical protein
VKHVVRSVYTSPTSHLRVLPDFLIIGAQRAGTTSLYRYLAQHPAVGPVVLTKGAHYFDTNYDRGLDWYRTHFPTRWHAASIRRRAGVPMQTGEGSPYYLFHPLVPGRVARDLPNVKLIALLRDPVERAYSQFQHESARGFEELSFEDAIDREEERLAGEVERLFADPSYHSFEHQHHSYQARGRYAEQILAWHEVLPPERLLVLHMESFFAAPEEGFGRVLAFLGLPAWEPPAFDRYNARRYSSMDPSIRARLEASFEEPNRRLEALVGIGFGGT